MDQQATYDQVKASFGPNAGQYTTSQGHADQDALAALVQKVGPQPGDRALDIGTGAGHTALAFAPYLAEVVAFDLTPQMLQEVRKNAAAKGLTNVRTEQGAAEKLPFPDAAFDLVTCRLTTHHFADLPQALREMGRVLKPGGRLVIVDTCAPEDDTLDRQVNDIEKLRDPSHVRNYRPSEWQALIEREAGLKVTGVEQDYYNEGGKMDFEKWTARIGTPAENKARLAEIFKTASPELAAVLQVEIEGDRVGFALPIVTLIAVKP